MSIGGKNNSMQIDEGRKGSSLLAIKIKARTVVGRGKKSLFSDLGSELRLGMEREESVEI